MATKTCPEDYHALREGSTVCLCGEVDYADLGVDLKDLGDGDPADRRGKEGLGGPWEVVQFVVRHDWSGEDRLRERREGFHLKGYDVSPERLDRIRKWRRDPLYGSVDFETAYPGGDPEQPDPPAGRDLALVAETGRLIRSLSLPRLRAPTGRRHPPVDFYELAILVDDFWRLPLKRQNLTRLIQAVSWNPRTNPHTARAYRLWRLDLPAHERPNAYTTLVGGALAMMKSSRAEGERPDAIPRAIRRGRRWLLGSSRAAIRPSDLHIGTYLWWFRNEVTRIIKRDMLGDVVSDARSFDDYERRRTRRWAGSESATAVPQSHAFAGRRTPGIEVLRQLALGARQRQIPLSTLEKRMLALADESDPGEGDDLTDYRSVAERLGTTRGTVKTAVLRIGRKLDIARTSATQPRLVRGHGRGNPGSSS